MAFQNLEIAGTPPTTGSLFNVPTGTTFTLTLNSDNFGGSGSGGDAYNAPLTFNSGTGTLIQSLQTGDVINGAGTGNVFNGTFNNLTSATVTGVSISGVQTYNLTNNGAATATLTGTFGGVTTLNNVSSSSTGVQLGNTATGSLTTALTNIGVSNTNTLTGAFFTAAALAGASDSLTVTVNNAGTSATTATVWTAVAGLATANGYETFAFVESGANFVALRGASTVNLTNNLTFIGAGSITVFGSGTAGEFAKIATIDGSSAAGAITITGKLTGASGLLTGDTSLTSIKTGNADDSVDITSMTLANFTGNNTTVNLGAGVNTLMVDTTVANTGAALTGITNVQILGVANATGTIDASKLPSSVTTIKLANAQVGALTINNGASGLTLDNGNLTANGSQNVSAAGAGTSDVLNIIMGSASGIGLVNTETVTGYETINITSQGSANAIFQLVGTASAGGSETLNIGGTTAMQFSAPGAGVGIVLNGNGTTINITDTAAVTIATPANGGSTNAKSIVATNSGGLLMGGVETGGSGTTGVSITGSSVAGKGNVLEGSTGFDVINGGVFKDSIVTNGGADQITLGAGHSGTHIGLYGANNSTTSLTPGAVQGAAANSVVNNLDQAAGGFWGVTGGTAASAATRIFDLFGASNSGGTSVDQSVVTGFSTASDVIDISLASFATSATHLGLVHVNGSAVTAGNAVVTSVTSGSTLAGNTVDLVVINGATFANAAALATALKTGTFGLNFSAVQSGATFEHLLFAYNDASGNAHIADVAINNAASASFAAQLQVFASDMVQLTGVSASSLASANLAFVA